MRGLVMCPLVYPLGGPEAQSGLSFVAAAFLHVPLRAFETAFRAPLSAGAAPLEEERWRSVECSGSRSSNVCLIENLLADRFYEAVVPFEEVVQVMRRKVVQELGFIFQG